MDHDLSNEFADKLSLREVDTGHPSEQPESENRIITLESLTQMLSEIQLKGDTRDNSEDQNASDNTSLNSNRSSGRDASCRKERNHKDLKARRVFVGNLSFKTSWQDLKDHMRQAGNVRKVNLFKHSTGRSKGCGLVEYETTSESAGAIQQMHLTWLDGREIFVREDDASKAKFDKQQFGSRNQRSRSQRYERNSRSPYRRRRDRNPRRKSRSRSAEKRRESSPSRSKSSLRRDRKYDKRRSSRRDGDLLITRNYSKDHRKGFERGYRIIVNNIPWSVTWQQLKNAFKEFGHVLRAEVPLNSSGRSAGYGLVKFERKRDAYAAIDGMDGVKFNERTIAVEMC